MHNIIDEKFWLAIAFFTFVFLCLKYILPILLKNLDEKSKQIAADLLAAKEARENAQKLFKESELQYNLALEKSKKLLIDAQNEAEKYLQDAKKAVELDIIKKTNILNERIKNEEERVAREIKAKIIASIVENIEVNMKNIEKNRAENVVKNSVLEISKLIH